MTEPQQIFVYGTLRTGQGNERVRNFDSTPTTVTPATLPGYDLHHLGGFPGIIPNESATAPVTGELLTYAPNTDPLTMLDRLEGYHGPDNEMHNLYNRVRVTVNTNTGPVQAWTYVYNYKPTHRIIETGDWLDERKYR